MTTPTPSEDLTEAMMTQRRQADLRNYFTPCGPYNSHYEKALQERGIECLDEIRRLQLALRAISLPKGERPTNRGAEIDLDEDDLATAVYKYRDSHPVQTEIAVNSPPRFSRNHWKELVEREQAGDIIADHIAAQDAHIDQLEAKLNGGK